MEKAKRTVNGYTRWPEDAVLKLLELMEAGKSYKEISEILSNEYKLEHLSPSKVQSYFYGIHSGYSARWSAWKDYAGEIAKKLNLNTAKPTPQRNKSMLPSAANVIKFKAHKTYWKDWENMFALYLRDKHPKWGWKKIAEEFNRVSYPDTTRGRTKRAVEDQIKKLEGIRIAGVLIFPDQATLKAPIHILSILFPSEIATQQKKLTEKYPDSCKVLSETSLPTSPPYRLSNPYQLETEEKEAARLATTSSTENLRSIQNYNLHLDFPEFTINYSLNRVDLAELLTHLAEIGLRSKIVMKP